MQIIAGKLGAGEPVVSGGTGICRNGITQAITSYLFNLADSTWSTWHPKPKQWQELALAVPIVRYLCDLLLQAGSQL